MKSGISRKGGEADVHSKYFLCYPVLDNNLNNFDGELEAIKAALENFLFRPHIT